MSWISRDPTGDQFKAKVGASVNSHLLFPVKNACLWMKFPAARADDNWCAGNVMAFSQDPREYPGVGRHCCGWKALSLFLRYLSWWHYVLDSHRYNRQIQRSSTDLPADQKSLSWPFNGLWRGHAPHGDVRRRMAWEIVLCWGYNLTAWSGFG